MASTRNIETDVVIIGGGGAGIAAALEGLDAGARVLVIEKAADPGGAAITSGGGCLIVGSPLQEKAGIDDSPDLAFDDWIKWGGPGADEVWARYYIEHTLHDLYHWAEDNGVTWVDLKFQEGNSVFRWTRAADSGHGLMTGLIKSYKDKGGEILTNTGVTGITRQGDRVTGITAVAGEGGDAVNFEISAKAVVVATGGFNSNLDMIFEVRPDLATGRILEGSGYGARGDGHKLLREQGGYFTHMGDIWFYVYSTPDYRDPAGRRGLPFRLVPGYIWINQQGRRFHNESLTGGNSGGPALMSQNPRHAWAVADRPMLANMTVVDPYYHVGEKIDRDRIEELLENSPFIQKADTLAELAKKMDVDEAVFLDTVARYNDAFAKGLMNEPDFGKPLGLSKPFDTPPYYAIQMFPLARKNFGGVKTDIRCRVLDKHFEPIKGLYAAGEVAGMAGGHINGKAGLEGTMLGPSIFSGRVAGGWAAKEAGQGDGFVGKANRD
ncbi:MAG: FAD-dependent oxidoreductase [Hyphomicrobiales bacterium]|nr:FAD-dependent oxidoreductase [Hyphomicrobiales bacterium]